MINRWLILTLAWLTTVIGAYVQGRTDCREMASSKVVEEIIEAQKEWNSALSEAERLDARDRCVAVGGLPDDCDVLLRGESSAPGE